MFFFNWLYRLFYGKDAADDMDRAPPPVNHLLRVNGTENLERSDFI
jgi:hypothetical protein